jgi:hypothetical protein
MVISLAKYLLFRFDLLSKLTLDTPIRFAIFSNEYATSRIGSRAVYTSEFGLTF